MTPKPLVDLVVNTPPDQMVKPPAAGRADVHAGTLANRLETLENRDVRSVVSPARALVRTLRPQPPKREKGPAPGSLDPGTGRCQQVDVSIAATPLGTGGREAQKFLQIGTFSAVAGPSARGCR